MSIARRSTTGHRPMMKHFLHTTASGGSPGEKTVADISGPRRFVFERPVGAYWQYQRKLSGPDLTQGVELSMVPDGTMLLGTMPASACALVRLSGRRRLEFNISIYEGARFPLLLVHAGRGKSGQQQAVTC